MVVGRLGNSKEARDISLVHLLRAAEVSVDKSLLLRGQPTSILETVDTDQLCQILEATLAEIIDITPE